MESGAKYAVLTTKHHDGVALWDTKYSDLNVVDKTPAKRDLVG
jgi:alpha-L-fucosidase